MSSVYNRFIKYLGFNSGFGFSISDSNAATANRIRTSVIPSGTSTMALERIVLNARVATTLGAVTFSPTFSLDQGTTYNATINLLYQLKATKTSVTSSRTVAFVISVALIYENSAWIVIPFKNECTFDNFVAAGFTCDNHPALTMSSNSMSITFTPVAQAGADTFVSILGTCDINLVGSQGL
jgi:hypothetical protein